MAIQFKTFPKGSLIGSGAYKFRHYGQEQPASLPWLCFTAQEANSTISMAVNGTPSKGQAFETSVDGTTWEEFIPGTTTITLANVGNKVYFRGDNTTFSESNKIYYKYVMTGKIAASGNVMSLIDRSCQRTDVPTYCYSAMFTGCTSLTAAPELPATTLATYCYSSMFQGCTSLTAAPELPATTLVAYCYLGMFTGCTSLTAAPELPATTLATYCYNSMFAGCTSLTAAPELPATTLVANCYSSMFDGCTSLTAAPELPATTLVAYCYSRMFTGCTSLTAAPELPATTLVANCYSRMFQGCTSLKVSETQDAIYTKPYRIPTIGTGTDGQTSGLTDMFAGTGGTFTGTPVINTTYYIAEV